jgi:hypothetical protein
LHWCAILAIPSLERISYPENEHIVKKMYSICHLHVR